MILNYNKQHNSTKLNNELIQLDFLQPLKGEKETDGVTPIAFIKSIDDEIEIRVDIELTQEQIEQVDLVIENHNPIELKEPSDTEILAQSVYEMAEIIELILLGGIE